ncbi:MAG: acetyl-CoA carboxylase carboxyltransferase subunit alpha [Verrucomicrobiae bacterium]|nr:acetyl-CoA carboxylase carboxyltransferase subunit alpha [Verrucomicrobiae bacterium]
MAPRTPRSQPLDFEKPIIEIEESLARLTAQRPQDDPAVARELTALRERLRGVRQEIYARLTSWQRVQIARHPARPYALDYAALCFDEFVELRGDRAFADDRSLIGGFARLGGRRAMLIGHQKGRDTKERALRNFGMAHPEGYRKALRLMRLASKFGLPVIALVDTPGAYPGIGAEERHIAEAIAVNLREMFALEVPIVAAVIGEGGSGGALGIAVADRVLILENAYYSVISPEGCAAILWKDRSRAPDAAEALKMSPPELLRLGIVDEVIPEPEGGAHHDPAAAAALLKGALVRHLDELGGLDPGDLRRKRHEKFRRLGTFDGG